ncbi:Kidins220 [Symbiodinium sp. KB8]|nr:Kidins220 [Symbiodinium sp. KB8]
MLRIALLSGEDVTSIPVAELSDVRALKQRLHQEHGLPPRFRQRLLHEGMNLGDAFRLDLPMDLEIVILAFSKASYSQRKELGDAAREGFETEVEALLQLPLNPDEDTSYSFKPLQLAAMRGHVEVARLLLEAGADKDFMDRMGFTALMRAARAGRTEVLRFLLEAGAQRDLRNEDGFTALMLACQHGHSHVVRVLLEVGAGQTLTNTFGRTAFMLASESGNAEVVRVLLEEGADKDFSSQNGWTALMWAAKAGHAEVVELLLAADARKDLKNKMGFSAVDLAADHGHLEILQSLLDAGAQNTLLEAEGESLSSMAVETETEAFLINAQGSDGAGTLRLDSEFPQYVSATHEEMNLLDGVSTLHPAFLGPCQRDLRSLVSALESTCKIHEPKELAGRPRDSEYHPDCFQDLWKITCAESARDILLYGLELVKAMQVPAELIWNYHLPEGKKFRKENRNTYRLVQKLFFLKSWLRPVAAPTKRAILWSGFWTDPEVGPAGRTSKESLFAFANLTEHDTLHPSTELGRIMEAHQELSACFHVENPIAQNMANNVWALASFMFVLGSEMQEQSTVVALVNKELEGERPLKQSVLFKHEMPTLGIAAYGLGHWSPQVLVIDMIGTCHRTAPALRHQLLSGGAAWYPVLQKFQFLSATDFAQRSTMSWTCWDCPESSCHLDLALAQAVQRVREAKDEADRNCKEALQAAAKGLHVTWTAELSTQCRDPSTGNRPQHVEAKRGLVSVVRLLLDKRADPNVKDSDGNTPLHYAVLEGHGEVVRLLLGNSAEPNVKNIHETMPLHLAARRGFEDAVRLCPDQEKASAEEGRPQRSECRRHDATQHGRFRGIDDGRPLARG